MTTAEALRFLSARGAFPGDETAPDDAVGLVGIPFDGAITYRSGAADGPAGLRRASDSIETYCPRLDLDLEDGVIVDYGDLDWADIDRADADGKSQVTAMRRALDERCPASIPLLAIGGDHLSALPLLTRAIDRWPGLTILHVDAHLDMRADWEGDPFNHSTVLGRALDHAQAVGHALRLISWGIRSGTRDEFELAAADPRVTVHGPEVGAATITEQLAAALAESDAPVYVTLDVDGLDPGDIPGTGTPEPGGLRFREVESALAALAAHRLVGADIVELAPALDPTGRSSVACARLARTLLLALRESARRASATLRS